MKILERTFGLEIELSDVDKRKVNLSKSFHWDKVEMIQNTDLSLGTYNSRYGGELQSQPLLFNYEGREILRELYVSLVDGGMNTRRGMALQVHIFAGDLEVEELKRVFYLCYYTSNLLKEICYEPQDSDEQHYRPTPTLADYKAIKSAKDLQALRQYLENSSNKGWVRHIVNIASFFVRQTVEFRLFNGTKDVWLLFNCILFSYRFLDYALTHTEEDFKKIKTCEEFRKAVKVPLSLPLLPPPLLFAPSTFIGDRGAGYHQALHLDSAFVSILIENTGERISCVHPQMYSVEVRLMRHKKVTIYNNDEFHHILYQLAKGELRIGYHRKAEFLQAYNDGSREMQVACLLVLFKLKKFFSDNEYANSNLEACKQKIASTFEHARKSAERICSLFEYATYKHGTLNDALEDGGEIFFQFDDHSKFRTTVGILRKNSDYIGDFERLQTHYDGIPADMKNATSLSIVSTNRFLPMAKVAKRGDKIFYKTGWTGKGEITMKRSKSESFSFPVPPDDLQIDDIRKLKVQRVKSSALKAAQEIFVKKVLRITKCDFAYMVFYDKWLLGGFGFNFALQKEYDIWLLSDFCTNNAIPRLSKLILLIVKSIPVRVSLSRTVKIAVTTCYTKVYTHAPVSMKYRGVFNLKSREDNHLLYETHLGSAGTYEDVLRKYKSYIKNVHGKVEIRDN